jgi:glycosyltransferase involved in cell wall biosynthesis
MKKILVPIDILIYLFLYCIVSLLAMSVLLLKRVRPSIKDISAKRLLQLVHYNIEDIEANGLSHTALQCDLTDYFEKIVTLIFSPNSSSVVDKCYKNNHRIISIPQQPDTILKRAGFLKTNFAFSSIRLIIKCIKIAGEEDIMLLRAQDPFMLGLTAFLCSRLTGIPYAIHVIQNYDISARAVRRMVFPPFLLKSIEGRLERAVFKNSRFVTSSYTNYKFYALSHGAAEERTFSLRTAVQDLHFKEPSLRADMKQGLGLAGKYMLFYAGRIEKIKFVEDLVLCLKEIKKEIGNASLVIAGSGKLKDRLIALAEELQVEDSLMFLGQVSHEKLVDLYYSADVILFTHAGITLVEAGLSGKPVAAYDHDWAGEFIGYNERGLLAPFRDIKALADSAVSLLRDKALSVNIGRSAREFAVKNFNLKTVKDLETSVLDRYFENSAGERRPIL